MLKKFGYSLIVVGSLLLGVCAVNTVLVGFAVAAEEGKKCEKCEHLPSKPEADCKCECHKAAEQPKEEKCEKCGHLPTKSEDNCKCVCHAKKGY